VSVLPVKAPRPFSLHGTQPSGIESVEEMAYAPAPGSAAVLLVDDVHENLVALEAVLAPIAEEHGLRLLTALTADGALRHALEEGDRLAVALLDVMMPGTDGPELARLIRARRQLEHVPVIFVTALDAERRRVTEAYQSGAVDYLTKPLDPDLIRAKVSAFVELHRSRDDARARERRRFADEARAISDLARAESAAMRARLALVLDSMPDAVTAFDRDWRFLYVNPVAAALLESAGREPAAVLGKLLWEVAPELRGTQDEEEFRRARAEGRVVAFEQHYAPLEKWLENRVIPGPDGTVTVFSRDVTAQRRAEAGLRASEARLAGLLVEAAAARDDAEAARAAAEDANGAKSQFLANMSHELRTPLNAIVGHVALVEEEVYGPVTESQRGALARVRRAQQHLLVLINNVLDFAKLEAGHVEYVITPVRLADVVGDAAAMLQPQAAAKGLTYAVRLPDRDLLVWADREKLRQVVLNLLSNAVKFTPAGGQVSVDVLLPEPAPDLVHLRVRDTGIGVPTADLDRIFDPFVQVHGTATRSARAVEGTGLGLAISRDLARGMNGDLLVESAVGTGSTFTLALRRTVLVSGEHTDRRNRDERRGAAERRQP
jgi:PAS domain S-box-containing protein